MNESLPRLLRAIAGSIDAKRQRHDVIFNAAADEIERLRAALLWLDHYEPELVAAAEEKFGFKLTGEQKARDMTPAERTQMESATRELHAEFDAIFARREQQAAKPPVCQKCQGTGYKTVEIAYHGERSEFVREHCDCKAST